MAKPKGKDPKHIEREEKKAQIDKDNATISDAFLDELKGAFTKFDKIPESKRIELYGDDKYLEQFWVFFKKEHPNLFDKMDKNKLSIYIQLLEDKGFTLDKIISKPETLQKEFSPKETETQVIQKSLTTLHNFCDDSTNNFPPNTFSRFASFAGFHPTTHVINPDDKISTIDDLYPIWKKFLDKEGITIGDTSANQVATILVPDYNPTERIMVEIALKKIRKELKGTLKDDFDVRFGYPIKINIFSPYQDILSFKNEWISFLDAHKDDIDEHLAKKLDAIIVTNGDIRNVLDDAGKKFDDTRGFSEWEQYFRRIFNKLATRQLFEEVSTTQDSIDHYIESLGTTFKEFPPYVNEIFKIHPFNAKQISAIDTSFDADTQNINAQIRDIEDQYVQATVYEEKKKLLKKKHQVEEQLEQRRWQAYVEYLKHKEPSLAPIFDILVANKFDFSVLSVDQQQLLINMFMKNKLQDTIKNKVPELLTLTEEELTTFIDELFDLKKMSINIPTKKGMIPLSFRKKEFMSSSRSVLPSIDNLERIQNLPLNFVANIDGSNDKFFEENIIFDSLYYDFAAKNGTFPINDAYKVRIKKDGKIVEGYLSAYSPIGKDPDAHIKDPDGTELYLYSQPVTSPSQDRTLITREGPADKTPVVIKNNEQALCDVEVIDRQINLNGEALGALLFGYVLGQQSMNTSLSPQKEEELAKKLGDLNVFKEKNEEEETAEEPIKEETKEVNEQSEYKKFINERKRLKGYGFPEKEYQENGGFAVGTRLFVPFADSELYPKFEGKSWLNMEIIKINKDKGTFMVKIRGGELELGGSEGVTTELSMNSSAFEKIKDHFGDMPYKIPNPTGKSMDEQLQLMESAGLIKDVGNNFGNIKRDSGGFVFSAGDYVDKKVTHFGRYEPSIGEAYDVEKQENYSLYEITYLSNGKIELNGKFKDGDSYKKYSRVMDYPNFLIFIKEKGLQPKSQEQAKLLQKQQNLEDKETPTTKGGFSINNVMSFFSNGFNKVKDAIKKYDDEKAEDLTDHLTGQGNLYSNIGKLFSPFGRISSSFETMGAEYFSERDNRIRKKVEKRKKFYEDADFTIVYIKYIQPMLKGEIVIKPHYKAAAMLLAMINKGKGPYNRNPEFAAKGMRVNILMGPAHQQRYLAMREKLVKELQQGAAMYGTIWADNKKNEILELEMKYMVHVMDARQLQISDNDKTKYYFYGKYSKQFIDELEKGYTGFFSQSTVDEGFGKVKASSFDFARAEYFRFLKSGRPQQAVPFIKVMAMKAMNDSQWKVFEMAVMSGMLSGAFLTMTMSETQGMIRNICRTRGFVPGIWIKNINQQTKLQRMLDIFSNGDFSKSMTYGKNNKTYDSTAFSYMNMSGGIGDLVSGFEKWLTKNNNLDKLSKFFQVTGKDASGKQTLLDIYDDPKTSLSDKTLIKEFIDNSNEKHETLDKDIQDNASAMAGSILTKSQTAVKEMMKFDNNGFAGANGDEIQTMEKFFTDMKDAIETRPQKSSEKVKFFLDKFFNRFDEKGFSLNNKTELIKRLKRCQQNPGRKEVDDILYYSIVGQVCTSFGRVRIPPEFHDALNAWKDFFKNNLDMILQPSLLSSSFGGVSYKDDYDRYSPKLEPWENCVNLLDRELKQAHMLTFPPEQRKLINQNLTRLKSNKNYINSDLYDLADKFYRDCGQENRFRSSLGDAKGPSSAPPSKSVASGAKIKNTEVIDKVRAILEGKNPQTLDDDFIAEDESYLYE